MPNNRLVCLVTLICFSRKNILDYLEINCSFKQLLCIFYFRHAIYYTQLWETRLKRNMHKVDPVHLLISARNKTAWDTMDFIAQIGITYFMLQSLLKTL